MFMSSEDKEFFYKIQVYSKVLHSFMKMSFAEKTIWGREMEIQKIPTLYAHGTNFGPELQENLLKIFDVLYNAGRIKSIQKHRYLSEVLGNSEQVAFCDAYLLKKHLEEELKEQIQVIQSAPRKRRM